MSVLKQSGWMFLYYLKECMLFDGCGEKGRKKDRVDRVLEFYGIGNGPFLAINGVILLYLCGWWPQEVFLRCAYFMTDRGVWSF